ncbi:unnamed protein product [Phytophthora fragariaefolia]|uniref:Unnamed protein product n=1 Tax=Phytophthora fragariaefolia TaxID=1490495 RepID=A0A9W6X290_9STRA|nr:unnamed protein product [Phytophthora fragariaefolia]
MMDYELFEDVGGERSLSDDEWDKVIQDMAEHEKRLSQFKQFGFPHAEICRKIGMGKEELPEPHPWDPSEVSVLAKRPSPSDEELPVPETKKARAEVKPPTTIWALQEEKLMMFLCWRAKTDKEKLADESVEPQGWDEVTNDLNNHCEGSFDEGTLNKNGGCVYCSPLI